MYVWKKLEEKDFINYFNKMCNDFPYEERRDCEKQKRLLSNENYNWYIVKDETGECAYLTYWEYDDFVFVEHFAIEKNKRGKGHGSLVLQEFIKSIDKKIILEVELPTDEYKIKRINFYRRVGFAYNDAKYRQPSYHGENSVPLSLMSYPNKLNCQQIKDFVRLTKATAYLN